MTATLYHADCREALKRLDDASVDSVVTDPPYELGFMGKSWDASGVAYDVELWRECLRVLKPGGHLLAFGGSRTWHRLACAIEDAGFELRDSIAWLYGSGFPKSLDVSKAIDKRGGNPNLAEEIGAAIKAAREARGWTAGQADQRFCGGSTNWSWFEGRKTGTRPPTPEIFAEIVAEWPELASWAEKVAEAGREVVGQKTSGIGTAFGDGQWAEGKAEVVDITAPATRAAEKWQGWGTALKPAFEPIVVARKPLIGTVASNVLEHGTGALNIDGCRVPVAEGEVIAQMSGTAVLAGTGDGWDRPWKNDPDAVAAREDRARAAIDKANELGRWPANVVLDESQAVALDAQAGESVSRRGRPRKSAEPGDGYGMTHTGAEYDDAGGPSRFFYVAKASKSERPKVDGVAHPTVKPLALMRWLVRLVTPPGGTVLEPFAGSGTTIEAALLEGFDVIGCEMTADYLPLIKARAERVGKALEVVELSATAEPTPEPEAAPVVEIPKPRSIRERIAELRAAEAASA